MSTDLLNAQIQRLNKDLNGLKHFAESEFIAALHALADLIEQHALSTSYSPFSLYKTRKQVNQKFKTDLVAVLEKIDQNNYEEQFPELINLCDKYKKNFAVSHPWLKGLTLLICSTLGLLIGAPLGLVVGFLASSLVILAGAAVAGAICIPGDPALVLFLGLIAAVGTMAGGILGGIYGIGLGYKTGEYATGTTFDKIINTLLLGEENCSIVSQSNKLKSATELLIMEEGISSETALNF